MKTRTLITIVTAFAAFAAGAASTAYAGDIGTEGAAAPASKTREQVMAELKAARADGSLLVWTSLDPLVVAAAAQRAAAVRTAAAPAPLLVSQALK